jgi:hypothetical protein
MARTNALRARSKLSADETTVPVLDPGRGRTRTGQLWAYAADDRSWDGLDPPGIAYVYAPDRKAERPFTHPASRASCRSMVTTPIRRWPARECCNTGPIALG